MDKLAVLTAFLHSIVVYNSPLLYGTVGEITVEKSGSLNPIITLSAYLPRVETIIF